MRKNVLMLVALAMLWVASGATFDLLTPRSAAAQDTGVNCAPGKSPVCICACVTPDPRHCETLPPQMPSTIAVRLHLTRYMFTEAPDVIQSMLGGLTQWADPDLDNAFASAVVTARCFSGGAAGPADPGRVPADQVKVYVLTVLDSAPPAQRALRPIVAAVPASVVRIGWLRVVELRRGLDYGALAAPQAK